MFFLLFSISRILRKQNKRNTRIIKVGTVDHLGKNEKHAVLILFSLRTERDTGDSEILNFVKDTCLLWLPALVFLKISPELTLFS